MKSARWIILSAAVLIALSAVLYGIELHAFGERKADIAFYTLLDLAWLPLEVLLVAILVERLLTRRERNERLQKLNMVIGLFFSELGTALLGVLTEAMTNVDEIRPHLAVKSDWPPQQFKQALSAAGKLDYRLDISRINLSALRDLLAGRRSMMVEILANPAMLEHERFTDLLWAIMHLQEELSCRRDLAALPASDLAHLSNDCKRAYTHLTLEWLHYARHLQKSYPYIFSILVRTHPLQPSPNPIVRNP